MYRQPKYKRRKIRDYRSAEEVLGSLLDLQLIGVLDGSIVWLGVTPSVSRVLDQNLLGLVDGGPQTAAQTCNALMHAATPLDEHTSASLGEVSMKLSLEEALWMAHVLGCLRVMKRGQDDAHIAPLDCQGLWDTCRQLRSSFLLSFITFHHFRCKGYFPRSGVQYGADYVLYQAHPSVAHSDFCVVALPAEQRLQWMELQISNRLASQVGKQLLVLYVQLPQDTSTLDSLEHVAVQERPVARWVPQSERDKDDEDTKLY